jgi:hypothetical protein
MIVKTTVTQGETHPPERSRISWKLWVFLTWRADSGLPELERLARTIDTWWPQIEAFLLTGITNAASKGHNRVIKLTSRCAYGSATPITNAYAHAASPPAEDAAASIRLKIDEPLHLSAAKGPGVAGCGQDPVGESVKPLHISKDWHKLP